MTDKIKFFTIELCSENNFKIFLTWNPVYDRDLDWEVNHLADGSIEIRLGLLRYNQISEKISEILNCESNFDRAKKEILEALSEPVKIYSRAV